MRLKVIHLKTNHVVFTNASQNARDHNVSNCYYNTDQQWIEIDNGRDITIVLLSNVEYFRIDPSELAKLDDKPKDKLKKTTKKVKK